MGTINRNTGVQFCCQACLKRTVSGEVLAGTEIPGRGRGKLSNL